MPGNYSSMDQDRHRRSIRMKGYDYREAGAYFVTLCTQDHKCILHDPVLKTIIEDVWQSLPARFPTVTLDEFVIMPNHIHFIICIDMPDVGASLVDTQDGQPLMGADVGAPLAGAHDGKPLAGARAGASPAPALGQIVGAFKSLVTTQYLQWVKTHVPSRRAKFWQRNYYEHIIRNEREWDAIQRYISANPDNWEQDPDNPQYAERPEKNTRDYLDDIRSLTH